MTPRVTIQVEDNGVAQTPSHARRRKTAAGPAPPAARHGCVARSSRVPLHLGGTPAEGSGS